MLVFKDAYLNEVHLHGSASGLNFGSTTFSIYVNNLPTVVGQFQINMYAADDTELHLSGHDFLSLQCDFQCDLDAIHAWLCVH